MPRYVRYGRYAVRTVRGTYGTAEAGTRTQYVQYVAPWGQAALRVRYVHHAEAGTRSPCVPNGGRGAYVSARERTGEAESVAIQYLFHSVFRMDVSSDDLKYEMSSG